MAELGFANQMARGQRADGKWKLYRFFTDLTDFFGHKINLFKFD
jgi:hypothetical protein